MNDDFSVVDGFIIGAIFSFLATVIVYQFTPTATLKDACEADLPRNQECEMFYKPYGD